MKITERYDYDFYDSLMISAALHAGCSTPYSEDVPHDHQIEGKITRISPFMT